MLIQGSSVECLLPGYSFPLNINTSRCRVHVPNNLTCLPQLLLPSLNNNIAHGPCFAPRLYWTHVVCLDTRRLLSSTRTGGGLISCLSHLLFLSSPSPILSSNPVSPFLFSSATPVKIRVPEGSVSSVIEQGSLLPLHFFCSSLSFSFLLSSLKSHWVTKASCGSCDGRVFHLNIWTRGRHLLVTLAPRLCRDSLQGGPPAPFFSSSKEG